MSALPDVVELGGVLRRYDWGSTTLLQQLCGQPPDGRPAAELWFGAHPGDPSPVLGATPGKTLDVVLAEAGQPPLPFLLKILAAGKALSLQVHPTREQAEAGYDREEKAGIPPDARERNYSDRNHKPELLCALTPFEALCGFRPVADTLAVLDAAAIAELRFLAERLRGPDGLRAAFTAVLDHPDPSALAAAVAASDHPELWGARIAASDFPGDAGAVLAVLLNAVRLRPGQAIYLGAGNVHCYLRGLGVEIMANSDNVLRCGLTSKHVDVAEVLAITDFSELADPVREPVDGRFEVPVPDFTLAELDLDRVDALGDEPARIVLVTHGAARVGELELSPGHAAFVPAGARVPVSGDATVFVASGRSGD
jgi:mannose-6-phosphate isomerase